MPCASELTAVKPQNSRHPSVNKLQLHCVSFRLCAKRILGELTLWDFSIGCVKPSISLADVRWA